MLLQLCKKCGKFIAEGERLWPVLIDEGSGIVTPMNVCQLCYETIDETQESKLLLETV